MEIAILGSTGSIGTSTLRVIDKFPERYRVAGLAAGKNAALLAEQIRRYRPRVACVDDRRAAEELRRLSDLTSQTEIVCGREGASRIATLDEADIVVAAISGSAGLVPTFSAVRAGKTVALANKESLVMAGELITQEARRKKCRIIPVDSEHSAVFQLIEGRGKEEIRCILLTASGGPFLQYSSEQLHSVTPEQALNHPRWKMGAKVTIDSATLMNKGLEVIEAHWLFNMPAEKIRVVIHPQSIVHSMAECIDGSVFAHMSQPDMQGPIAYALSYPDRLDDIVAPLDLAGIGDLTFQRPDEQRFPSLRLAYTALEAGGLMPAVMSAANEVAVERFRDGTIGFMSIPLLTGKVMERFRNSRKLTLENILRADAWARGESENVVQEIMAPGT